jgi:DUF1680 family protein
MEMPVQVLEANYHVEDDSGRVAVQRGPLLYCLEEQDQPNVALSEVQLDVGKNPSAQFRPEQKSDLLGGVVVLRHEGTALQRASEERLYSRYKGASLPTRRVPLTFIPYYAWANRNATSMQVWTPVARSA